MEEYLKMLEELREADDRVYNLNLYLAYIERNYPGVFAQLEDHFDGLPGYAGTTWYEGEEEEVTQNGSA